MLVKEIKLKNGPGLALRMQMNNAALLVIRAKKGFVMCGYLNMSIADKLGDAACMVTGVDTFDDVFNSKVIGLSQKASELGIKEGMTGREALDILS